MLQQQLTKPGPGFQLPQSVDCHDCGSKQDPLHSNCTRCRSPFQVRCACDTLYNVHGLACPGCGKTVSRQMESFGSGKRRSGRPFIWSAL